MSSIGGSFATIPPPDGGSSACAVTAAINSEELVQDRRGELYRQTYYIQNCDSIWQAKGAYGLPQRGQVLDSNPSLICQQVVISPLLDSDDRAYVATVYFGYPDGSILLPTQQRVVWAGSLATELAEVDLDGKQIGDRYFVFEDGKSKLPRPAPLDPDARIGANVDVPQLQVEIALPIGSAQAQAFRANTVVGLLGKCNATDFRIGDEFAPPGYVRFDNVSARAITNQPYDTEVVYQFTMAEAKLPTGVPVFQNWNDSPWLGGPSIPLRYGYYPKFYPIDENGDFNDNPDEIVGRSLASIWVFRRYETADFSGLSI